MNRIAKTALVASLSALLFGATAARAAEYDRAPPPDREHSQVWVSPDDAPAPRAQPAWYGRYDRDDEWRERNQRLWRERLERRREHERREHARFREERRERFEDHRW